MHYSLSALTGFGQPIEKVRVLSYEVNYLLVEIYVDGVSGILVDDQEKPLHFASINHVKRALMSCKVQQAELVHESAYDEMIGNPDDDYPPMIIPLQLTH
jgi:hypothetical protein